MSSHPRQDSTKKNLKCFEGGQIRLPGGPAKDDIDKLTPAASVDETGRFQFLQMMREGGSGNRECGAKVGAGHTGMRSYLFKDLETAAI